MVLAAASGWAQDAPPTQYHVTQDTFGCTDPEATRALTDPRETRGIDSAWFKGVFGKGQCVTITPRSPWRFLSRDGDVALMSYAGSIGAPGSYYLKVDQLVDPQGQHPGDAPSATPAPSPAANPNQTANPGTSDQSAALAPQPQISGQTSGPSTAGPQSPWARIGWLMLLVAVIGGAVLLAWRSSPTVAGGRRRSEGYPLHLPDHVMNEAKRLAAANGATLDQFLATLIAERIGEMKAAQSRPLPAREIPV